jgi:hypothetical protein
LKRLIERSTKSDTRAERITARSGGVEAVLGSSGTGTD